MADCYQNKKMATIEIFWSDLTPEAQEQIVKAIGEGIGEPENNPSYNNWDVIPMCMFDIILDQGWRC